MKLLKYVIGSAIKKYLKENGISQTFVSNKTGISRSLLNESLNNKRRLLAEELYAIAEVLNVPLETFRKSA